MWQLLLACGSSVENELVRAPEPVETFGTGRKSGRVWLVEWPAPEATLVGRAAYAAIAGPPASETGALLQAVDLDGDGVDELIVGSPYEAVPDEAGVVSASGASGRARVLRDLERLRDAVHLPGPGAVIEVGAGETLHALVAVGDQTGDAVPDLVLAVGSAAGGRAHLLDGASAVEGALLGPADAVATVTSSDEDFGRTLAAAGDLDGDGRDDLLLNHDGAEDGRALIVWRGDAWIPGEAVGVRDPPAIRLGPAIRNAEVWHAPVGDLGADGVPDLVVPQAQLGVGGATEAGAVAVIDGATAGGDGFLQDLPTSDSRIEGSDPEQRLGTQVSGIGDLDGDGVSEVAIVARDPRDPEAWIVHVFSGAELAAPGVRTRDDALFSLPGFHAVFPAPDLDDDGVPELVVLAEAMVVVLSGARLPEAVPLSLLATGGVAPTWWNTRVVFVRTARGYVLALGLPDDDLVVAWPE